METENPIRAYKTAQGIGYHELARRLGMMAEDLAAITPAYEAFEIHKLRLVVVA